MGQKVHPYGIRLGYIKPWKAKWFAKKSFGENLHEDLKLRKYLKDKLGYAGISSIEIERSGGRVRVRIHTARPGVIIGRRGQEIDKVKDDLAGIAGAELFVDIKEIKAPQTDAQLVAENIALQLQKRIGFRRAMKKAVQTSMSRGALGIKVLCKGRLGGAEIARTEKYRDGKVPLSTFRADVDYGFTEAHTTYGSIGVKVWIYKGDILVKKEAKSAKDAMNERMSKIAPESDGAKDNSADEKKTKKPKAKKKAVEAKKSEPAAETSVAVEEKPAKEETKKDESNTTES